MLKTRPPLGVVPFEDRLAPAGLESYFLTPAGSSWLAAAQAFMRHQAAIHAPATPGVQEWRLQPVASVGQLATLWKATEISTTAPEATPVADPGPVTRGAGNRGSDRDAGPVAESRGSSLGPVADAPPRTVVSALTTQADAPPADPAQAAPAADRAERATAGPVPVFAAGAAAGRPLFTSTDYVFLETESAEPPLAESPSAPGEPLQPDEPEIVPAVAVEPSVAPEATPVSPLAGLLPFNVSDLEGTAPPCRPGWPTRPIDRRTRPGPEYTLAWGRGLAAAGAVYAPPEPPGPGPDGPDGAIPSSLGRGQRRHPPRDEPTWLIG